jgi:hypothetical protein
MQTGVVQHQRSLPRRMAAGAPPSVLAHCVTGPEPFHRAAGIGVEYAPADEFLGEVSGGLIVDDRQRAEIFVPHGKDADVVVATLALDDGDVAGERADLVLGQLSMRPGR